MLQKLLLHLSLFVDFGSQEPLDFFKCHPLLQKFLVQVLVLVSIFDVIIKAADTAVIRGLLVIGTTLNG